MASLENIVGDCSKPIFLHHQHEKFWEIKALEKTPKVLIRCGKLLPGDIEAKDSLQEVDRLYNNKEEMIVSIKKLVGIKLSKGYQKLDKAGSEPTDELEKIDIEEHIGNGNKNSDIKRKNERAFDDIVLKQVKNNQSLGVPVKTTSEEESKTSSRRNSENNILNFLTERKFNIQYMNGSDKGTLLDKALDLHLECNFDGDAVVIKGYQSDLEKFKEFFEKLKKNEKKTTDMSVLKEIPIIQSKLRRQGSAIEKKALELGLICEVRSDKIVVLGSEADIEEKMGTLKSFMELDKEESKENKNDKEEKKEEQKSSSDKYVRKEFLLSKKQKDKREDIENEAKKAELYYEFYGDKLYILGYEKDHATIGALLKKIDEEEPKKDTPAKTPSKDDSKIVSKEWKLSTIEKKKLEEMKKKATELDLMAFEDEENLYISGASNKVKEVSSIIEGKKEEEDNQKDIRAGLSKISIDPSAFTAEGGGSYEQKELNLSTFHRGRIKDLETRAASLDLITDFGYDVVLVSGQTANIAKFILALYEVETEAKRSLYPKYWDFHETRPFSKIKLADGSTEYKKVAELLNSTMDRQLTIVNIERVQNKYLMEHYVTNIQKRMESRPDEDINRLLLFHGTRNYDPELICKSFDTGFDLQYAQHGSYGKGLYFALNASYSCNGYQHATNRGTYQVIIADVFLGKHANRTEQNGLKAQSGFDSVFSGSFYIIYNNFHSYPLYLLEYRDNQLNGGRGGGLFAGGMGRLGGGAGTGLFGNRAALPTAGNMYGVQWNGDDEDDEDYDEDGYDEEEDY